AFGFRKVRPAKSAISWGGVSWSLDPESLSSGLVIDHWVAAAEKNGGMSTDVSSAEGTLRVGARVKRLAVGSYRYYYAIANIDWAIASVSGEADMLRVS